MITIKITRSKRETWNEKENVLVKETPTDKQETADGGYSSSVRTAYARAKEYAVMEVTKSRTVEVTLLEQNVEDSEFNLATVIAAINNLQKPQQS